MSQPNLSHIKEISGGDEKFELEFLKVIQRELPVERDLFNQMMTDQNFKSAAELVHKIKHKIGLLSMDDGYNLAIRFEDELKKGQTGQHQEFLVILDKISVFLKHQQ